MVNRTRALVALESGDNPDRLLTEARSALDGALEMNPSLSFATLERLAVANLDLRRRAPNASPELIRSTQRRARATVEAFPASASILQTAAETMLWSARSSQGATLREHLDQWSGILADRAVRLDAAFMEGPPDPGPARGRERRRHFFRRRLPTARAARPRRRGVVESHGPTRAAARPAPGTRISRCRLTRRRPPSSGMPGAQHSRTVGGDEHVVLDPDAAEALGTPRARHSRRTRCTAPPTRHMSIRAGMK
jgi:hypothetical protein